METPEVEAKGIGQVSEMPKAVTGQGVSGTATRDPTIPFAGIPEARSTQRENILVATDDWEFPFKLRFKLLTAMTVAPFQSQNTAYQPRGKNAASKSVSNMPALNNGLTVRPTLRF